MIKIIRIPNCGQCPCSFYNNYPEMPGLICSMENREVREHYDSIPDWCPLETLE